jgi:UPF0755 protein
MVTRVQRSVWLVIALIAFIWVVFVVRAQPPEEFPVGTIVTIKEGDSVKAIAEQLKERNIIRSPLSFSNLVILLAGERGLKAGDYFLARPYALPTLVLRMSRGTYDLAPIKVTIPEGFTVEQIATTVAEKFYRFDPEEFIRDAGQYEGFLFPETYFFLPNVQSDEVIRTMRQTFEDHVIPVVRDAGREPDLHSIVTLASLVEEEGTTAESRQIIAGILLKRLDREMPLQVDATIGYIFREQGVPKPSLELTKQDLAVDSPYNTYTNLGLPPAPIANPGLESIEAVLNPIETPYLFYLSDEDDEFHYARTLDEHNKNIEKYLR